MLFTSWLLVSGSLEGVRAVDAPRSHLGMVPATTTSTGDLFLVSTPPMLLPGDIVQVPQGSPGALWSSVVGLFWRSRLQKVPRTPAVAIAEGVTEGSSSQHPAVDPSDDGAAYSEATPSALEEVIRQADALEDQAFCQALDAVVSEIYSAFAVSPETFLTNLGAIALTSLVQETDQISYEQVMAIKETMLMPDILVGAGFLQASGPRQYQFPHRRVQAYFAGYTLAQQFLSKNLEVSSFLFEYKYTPWYDQISSFMAREVLRMAEVEDVAQLLGLFGEEQERVDLPHLLLKLRVVHEWLCMATEDEVDQRMAVLEQNLHVMNSLEAWFCKGLDQVRQEGYDPTSPGGQLGLLIDSLQGFRSILWQAPGLLNLLQQTAQDSHEEVHARSAAFYALARIMSVIPRQSGEILETLSEADAIPRQSGEILETLKKAAEDEDWDVRHALVEALGAAISADPQESEAILEILIEAAKNEDWYVRYAAVEALGRATSVVPNQSEKILPTLCKAARDTQSNVRQVAVEALGGAIAAFPGESAVILETLHEVAAHDEDGLVRQASVKALGGAIAALPSESTAILETLHEVAAHDEDGLVRQASVKALGGAISAFPGESAVILETLHGAIDDPDSLVRQATVEALGGAISVVPNQSEKILPTLHKAAKDRVVAVRKVAKKFFAKDSRPRRSLRGSLIALTKSRTNQLLVPQGNRQLLSVFKPAADQHEQTLHTYKLGKLVWEQYYGDVSNEPPLPENIEEIMESPCPFWEGKRIKETHLLALIPTHVAGKPLTLGYLGELIKSPRGEGHGAKYSDDWGLVHLAQTDIRNPSPDSSYWVLMTRDVLPDSRNKCYQDQCALVKRYEGYTFPGALEATVVVALHHVRGGEGALLDTYTRCWDEDRHYTDCHLAVGISPSVGLNSSSYCKGLNSSSNLSSTDYFRNFHSSEELASVVDTYASILFYSFYNNYSGELGVAGCKKF